MTGATGFIGRHLARHFVSQGYGLLGLCRQPPGQSVDGPIEYAAWDLGSPVARDVLRGCRALVHCAHALHSPRCPDSDKLNIEGSARLFEAALESGVDQIVFLSSLSAQPHIRSHYARSKLAVEGLMNPARDAILRLGLVLGPGGFAKRLQTVLSTTRVVPLVDGGRQPLWTIHIEDLCAIVTAVLEGKSRGILHIGHPQRLSVAEVSRALARAQRRRVFFLPLPFWCLYPPLKLAEELGLELSVTTENLLGLRGAGQLSPKSDIEQVGCEVGSFEELLESGAVEEWISPPASQSRQWSTLLRPGEREILEYARRETNRREAARFQPLQRGLEVGLAVLLGVGLCGLVVAPARAARRFFRKDS